MFYNQSMSTLINNLEKIAHLSRENEVEADGTGPREISARCKALDIPITLAQMQGGKTIRLMKTMVSSVCKNDCNYCVFRAGHDTKRETMQPDEIAKTFIELESANLVDGLFLSSGIFGNSITVQDKIIATAEILRYRYQYRGYLHLKIMPGTEKDQIQRALQLGSRVSINLEAPTTQHLAHIAPAKEFKQELLQPLLWINQLRKTLPPEKTWLKKIPSVTTQFVVGGSDESDLELLKTTDYLYNQLHLQRAYFSPFNPIPNTPLSSQPATPFRRKVRLYQASFLIKQYGFSANDLIFDGAQLPQEIDPKLAWAKTHLAEDPIEINQASFEALLKIPGIGKVSANKILNARRALPIKNESDLRNLGVLPKRALPFITMFGKKANYQLELL